MPGPKSVRGTSVVVHCFIVLLVVLFIPSRSHAQTATQTIKLQAGWNAVWLEVEPTYDDNDPNRPGQPKSPDDAFNLSVNTSIDVIASPKQLAGLAEFFGGSTSANADTLDQGTVNPFNQSGWEIWRSSSPVNANNLVMTTGNRPYLINTTSAVTLNLVGKVEFFRPTWTPDRYNLVGFGLTGTPTFDVFFGPSGGKHVAKLPDDQYRIFKLETSGNWRGVEGSEPMAADEAYWIFSNGPSDYMGPVAVDFDFAITGQLNFSGPADAVKVGTGSATVPVDLDLEEIILTSLNPTNGASAIPALELISTNGLPGTLELYVVTPVSNSLAYARGNRVDSTVGGGSPSPLGEAVAPQTTAVLTIGALRNWSFGPVGRTDVYRLRTGAGAEFWLPVTALNSNIQLSTDLLRETDTGKVAGLWVGEISIDTVTSIVEDGAPTRPSAGSAPIRVLLHSDSDGAVTLLSQVTVMQTRTADPEVPPVPVLVVDPAQIPFFEGVKERNGNRVGLRLEAVAYDMPRRFDGTSQMSLIEDPAYPELTTPEGIPDFLVQRLSRPPSLQEVYHFSWPVDGAIGEGKTLRTAPERPLMLDPFHRSNPFRHAYHNAHTKGPNINRSITIVFDTDQSPDGRLRGSYAETVQGLIQSDLKLTGTVQMQRVSPVANLEQ